MKGEGGGGGGGSFLVMDDSRLGIVGLPFTSVVSWLRVDCSFPFFFFFLLVEWREVRKRLPPAKRVAREDLPG